MQKHAKVWTGLSAIHLSVRGSSSPHADIAFYFCLVPVNNNIKTDVDDPYSSTRLDKSRLLGANEEGIDEELV